MGQYLAIVDTDKMLAMQSSPPIFINTVRNSTVAEKTAFNELIYSLYDGDVLNNVASCECGELIGGANKGCICTNCNKPVRVKDLSDIEPVLWLKTPEGIGSRMINPRILQELCDHFTKNSFSIIRYLVDMTYPSECKIAGLMDYLHEKGIKRGYKYFYDNYDYIIDSLFEHKLFRRKKNQVDERPIEIFLRMNRDITFCDYLPLPNKTMLVIEENATGVYRDKSIERAIDAMRTVVGLDLAVKDYSPRVKENRMIKAIFLLIEFVDNYIKNEVRGKPGVIRKHVIAGRTHFAYRAVIISNTGPHDYETLYMPWMAATSMLRLHLAVKLKKLGMTQREITTFLSAHAQKYHPLIDRLFKELIAEAGGKGIPVLFVRNPSLMRGSIQRFFISQVKTDTSDPTTTLSILAIVSPNADFDGDACTVMMCMDQYVADACYAFAPHQNVPDVGNYRELTNACAITKPVSVNTNNWYRDNEVHESTAEQEAFMRMLEQESVTFFEHGPGPKPDPYEIFERNKLRNFQNSSRLEGINIPDEYFYH